MSAASGADELERRYLNDIFAELCRIESPSGRERACAERVAGELRALGIEVHEDDAAQAAGSDCGNLLARIPGGGGGERPCVLLCAHLDTVPPQAPVEPVVREGFWENANAGILGADNKAAVAVLLALARRVYREGAAVDLELLFTVGEEVCLAGARAFDTGQLRSPFGYAFDHASPIGEIVLATPSHYRLQATFTGAAAHAGVRPEEGRNAILAAARAVADMRLGRIDAESTANVGTIAGGSAINVVPERCVVVAEVRSQHEQRATELVAELVDCVHEAANLPECECDVDVDSLAHFRGLSHRAHQPRGARRRAGAACVRPRARACSQRRRLRRQRADGERAGGREPRERHRAQPRARRARRGRRAGGDARCRARAAAGRRLRARRGGGRIIRRGFHRGAVASRFDVDAAPRDTPAP